MNKRMLYLLRLHGNSTPIGRRKIKMVKRINELIKEIDRNGLLNGIVFFVLEKL